MQTHEIRKRFLDHFVDAGHTEVPSASVILDDPNLLFVNAGMVQFVPYFLGQRTPAYSTATSVQKCIRTPDIDEVGITTRHNTFFQMAGNFSFGDYFKRRAIELAWTLLTNPISAGGYGFDPERLWATVFYDDDEAVRLWQEVAGLPSERIQRRGMADNYWSMGIPGPCGPCSEIYYDRGPEYGVEGGPEANEDRYIEIWNLVFMQNERGDGTGKDDFEILGPLPRKNIDTGMGVERIACLLQGVDNVYETDLLRPMIDAVARHAPRGYGQGSAPDDVRYRVIADHSRTAAIIIADGVTPSNEGRGYVLRRLLRRIIRAAKLLGIEHPIVGELMATVRDAMGPSYPELVADFDRISRIAVAEETAFNRTLASGSKLFEDAAAATRSAGRAELPGAQAFALHDTYGFPIELTLEMAAEAGLTRRRAGLPRTDGRAAPARQGRRRRPQTRARRPVGVPGTGRRRSDRVHRLRRTELARPGSSVSSSTASGCPWWPIIRGCTPRPSPRSGWRSCSTARRSTPSPVDRSPTSVRSPEPAPASRPRRPSPMCRRSPRRCGCTGSTSSPASSSRATPSSPRWIPKWRRGATQGHSGTHMVHAALRQVLGPNAVQAGSLNRPGYLRFDFNWQGPLTEAQRNRDRGGRQRGRRGRLRGQHLPHQAREGQSHGRDGAVRRAVPRRGPGRRDRRAVLAGIVRRHPRAQLGADRSGHHPRRVLGRLRGASGRGLRRSGLVPVPGQGTGVDGRPGLVAEGAVG